MASISKRGAKWIVRWRDADGAQKTRTCPTKAAATKLRLEIETEQSLGRDWQANTVREVPCLSDIFGEYLKHRALRLSPNSIRIYSYELQWFLDWLREQGHEGILDPKVLSRALLEAYYAYWHEKGVAVNTARQHVARVQVAWAWAEESERWPGAIPRPRKIDMVRTPPPPVVAPTWAEMAACVQASRRWRRKLAAILYYCGLRVGETMLLTWDDVDIDAKEMTIRAEISKTKAGRIIPIPSALASEMAGWGQREGWLIYTGLRNRRPLQAAAEPMRTAWQRTSARPSAYTDPHHSFRRGYKSGMLSLGCHPDAVDYLQGHVIAGSRGRYIDPAQAFDLRAVVEKVPVLTGTSQVASLAARRDAKSGS